MNLIASDGLSVGVHLELGSVESSLVDVVLDVTEGEVLHHQPGDEGREDGDDGGDDAHDLGRDEIGPSQLGLKQIGRKDRGGLTFMTDETASVTPSRIGSSSAYSATVVGIA